MELDGLDLLSRSNKTMLEGIQHIPADAAIIFSACLRFEPGRAWFSKPIGSRYVSGRTRVWLNQEPGLSGDHCERDLTRMIPEKGEDQGDDGVEMIPNTVVLLNL